MSTVNVTKSKQAVDSEIDKDRKILRETNQTNPSPFVPPPSSVLSAGPTTTAATANQLKVSFYLKTSIFKRKVTIEKNKLALGVIKQIAIGFLNELYFDAQNNNIQHSPVIGSYIAQHFSSNDAIKHLHDKIVLKKYNVHDESMVAFNSVQDIEQDSYICIEVSERPSRVQSNSNSSQPSAISIKCYTLAHEFKQETYLTPTKCDVCRSYLLGFTKQGYQCNKCKKNFCSKHKILAEECGDTCMLPFIGGQSTSQTPSSGSSSYYYNFAQTSCKENNNIIDKQKDFHLDAASPENKGSAILDTNCNKTTQKKTIGANLLNFNFTHAFRNTNNNSNSNNILNIDENKADPVRQSTGINSSSFSAVSTEQQAVGSRNDPFEFDASQSKDVAPVAVSKPNGGSQLRRLTPSVKHVKQFDATKSVIEGWLAHQTQPGESPRRHYWRADFSEITLYENETSKRYFSAIPLSKISSVLPASSLPKNVKTDIVTSGCCRSVAATTNASPLIGDSTTTALNCLADCVTTTMDVNAMFVFKLKSGSMYFVQAESEADASGWRQALSGLIEALKKKEDEKKKLETIVAAENNASSSKVGTDSSSTTTRLTANDVAGANECNDKATLAFQGQQQNAVAKLEQADTTKTTTITSGNKSSSSTAPTKSRLHNRPRITIKLDKRCVVDHLVAGKYLIERNRVQGYGFEELGSGQFGKVYAAVSDYKVENASRGLYSGIPVAIKEISKARFDLRQQAKLKNEAQILSRLDHPGVIILERVYDFDDKVYIVMEQLEDDMLEMIMSTEERCLSERVTKFLTYQILEALRYLHSQNIVHCDLKPENVLLVERRSQFPQIKLCDFGYAKIIEENSFRSSLIGTQAYLAPEVVRKERYNRSVDLWSTGVIVYVSLSGEFPFTEGESIQEQISKANFMYPQQPWAKISQSAKMFINSLLRVNSDQRLSARKAQMLEWVQDFQLWCDLTELEVRAGRRWVTDDADFERWSKYAKEHGLRIPRSAIQLSEKLPRQ